MQAPRVFRVPQYRAPYITPASATQAWRELAIAASAIPQRSNAARVRNMSRYDVGRLPGNSKHFFKKSKDKALPGKRSFKR